MTSTVLRILPTITKQIGFLSLSARLCSDKIGIESVHNYVDNLDNNRKKALFKQLHQVKFGPPLEHFIVNNCQPGIKTQDQVSIGSKGNDPLIFHEDLSGNGRKVYFDVHGCQMNTNDTEIVWSILREKDYQKTTDITDADVVLVMTCAIREGAETKIWKKLRYLSLLKKTRPLRKGGTRMKIGIIGCMAERLKSKIIEQEKMVDLVCGPDAYKDLPRLLALTHNNQTAVNVLLSLDETYADVMPVRLNEDSVTAYVSIMRGCDNMCSYCIVPFTRGRERSRPIDSILEEVKILSDQGVKEVTLLGQNVNSYCDYSTSTFFGYPDRSMSTNITDGFHTIYKAKSGGRRFSELLDKVSAINPEMRIRFTSPHPKDFPNEVLQLIKERPNICKQLHLPAQSGNDMVLKAMRRGYTVEAYLQLIDRVRSMLPDVAITSDFISGFCTETEAAHQDTLNLIWQVKYSMVFCYPYSMREKTHAYHKLEDTVPTEVKSRRFKEIADVFRQQAAASNARKIGQYQLVLVEGTSKKNSEQLFGRNDGGLSVVFPSREFKFGSFYKKPEPGEYVVTKVIDATSQTLHGEIGHISSIADYHSNKHQQNTHF